MLMRVLGSGFEILVYDFEFGASGVEHDDRGLFLY